jgi:hypothetical protein
LLGIVAVSGKSVLNLGNLAIGFLMAAAHAAIGGEGHNWHAFGLPDGTGRGGGTVTSQQEKPLLR